ncbi:MAG: xanthine dehydrogenase family protein molybdopterin-binding subunit [Chitinophagales bacterium]|nr:xanthine dehydrogenase family protein molybdopterin-binding subunit [Chitinophagales bacterium]
MDKNYFFEDTITADEKRVDGVAKVTGAATFSAEHTIPGLTYAVFVCSTIARGTIKNMVLAKAKNAPGVIDIIYYLNCPVVPGYTSEIKEKNQRERVLNGLNVFADNIVYSNGQPIALVIADTWERAVYAASLVKVEYIEEKPETDFDNLMQKAEAPGWGGTYKRGDEDAYKKAEVMIENEYSIPAETHNPIEPHATVAVWEKNDKLVVYDKTQGPKSTQGDLALLFGLKRENIQVITEFVGGAFGCALRTWPHTPAACIAAKKIGRPVKLVLTREQMFTMVGYRPISWQKIGIGASRDGKLTGITHHAISNTSRYEQFSESIVDPSQNLHDCPNVNTSYKTLALDINTPIWMRGPGPATGCFALESALDELAYKLNMDPIELRLKNYAEVHPQNKLPWTSKHLKECYELGREKIGWHNRPSVPGTLKENGMLTGYGMGVGVFWAGRSSATARGTLYADGMFVLQSAISDMGPGTTTAMVSIAAEQMGLPPDKIRFELGNTDFPTGPTQGGSGSTTAVGTAVTLICEAMQVSLKEMAIESVPGFKNYKPEELDYKNGKVSAKTNSSTSISYTDIIKQSGKPELQVSKSTESFAQRDKYAMNSFSAHFVKLHVHPVTGVITLKKIVAVADCGRVISETTARSQMVGGAVGGIGMAMHEETLMDHHSGRYINANLADYHVPVNADIPAIDVLFVNKPDNIISPTGAKGIGEIALVGVAPAVANAVYNATGKRITRLPITPDKLI